MTIIRQLRSGPTAALAALALAAATPTLAQPLSTDIQVQVWRDGAPVRGLTAASFEVWENGKRVRVTGVEEIDFAAAGEATLGGVARQLPPADRRHLLLLFDLPALSPDALGDGLSAARELVSDALLTADLVAVAAHRGAGGLELLVPPTIDHRQALAGIEALARRPIAGGAPERPQDGTHRSAGPIVNADSALAAAQSGNESARGIVQQRQGEIHGLIRALAKLAQVPRSTTGETAVVLFSRSFDSSAILGNVATHNRDWAADRAAAEAAAGGELWRVNSASRFGGGMVETALFQTLDEYRRIGCSIHALDLGADSPRLGQQGLDGLMILADRTRGSFVESSAELAAAVTAALEPSAFSYLVTFEPRRPGRSGYRRLEVGVTGIPDRLSIRHRPGYHGPAAQP